MSRPTRKAAALLVGINYITDPRNRLNGCCNDVMNMARLLISKYNFPANDVRVIADLKLADVPKTRKQAIITALNALKVRSISNNLDLVYFHYSGHGSQQRDQNADERDGLDEGLCPADFARSGLITDDELAAIFKQFNPRTRIIVVMDCCHSGSILDLPYLYNSDGTPNETNTAMLNRIHPNIISLSGCVDSDTSADAWDPVARQAGGALTMSLIKALTDNTPDTSLFSIHKQLVDYIKQGQYEQRPVLSSSVPLTADSKLL